MDYRFMGHVTADSVRPVNCYEYGVESLLDLYNVLSDGVWRAETCAPRMREDWSKENKTLGQCSITAFLVQDIFGGEVYGVRLADGNFHCYNVIEGKQYDLTIEQFGEKAVDLVYDNNNPQSRELHFAKTEKYERYLPLKELLKEARG